MSSRRRILFIVYTETDSGIRLIGARAATAENNKKKATELDPLAPRPKLDFSKGDTVGKASATAA